MQSTESKTKRSRKSGDEEQSAQVQTPSEEVTKTTRRKSAGAKSPTETSSSAKQHRGSARKTVAAEAVQELAAAASASATSGPSFITVPVSRSISEADIASLAYTFWAERNFENGSPVEDWLRAERELKIPLTSTTASRSGSE